MNLKSYFFAVLICLAGLFGGSSAAHASNPISTYYFTGTCGDCTGTGEGTLLLQHYTPGNELTKDNFYSFSYAGTDLLGAFTISEETIGYLSGKLGTTNGAYNVFFYGTSPQLGADTAFASYSGGFWCTGEDCGADEGGSNVWSQTAPQVASTPEPASFALLGTGITALFSMRKRFVRG